MTEQSIAKRAIVPLLFLLVISVIAVEAMRPSRFPDMTFSDLDGRPLSTATWRSKPWYLVFWSVDCGSCLADFPTLIRLQERLSREDGRVVTVAIAQDPPNRVRAAAAPLRAAGIVVVHDRDGRIAETLGHVGVTPYGFLIDRDGFVDRVTVGPIDLSDLASRLDP